jgi:hypothetical protein
MNSSSDDDGTLAETQRPSREHVSVRPQSSAAVSRHADQNTNGRTSTLPSRKVVIARVRTRPAASGSCEGSRKPSTSTRTRWSEVSAVMLNARGQRTAPMPTTMSCCSIGWAAVGGAYTRTRTIWT